MPPKNKDPIDRLVAGTKAAPSGCIEWQGWLLPSGYGEIWLPAAGREVRVHRFAYESFVGPIPLGLGVLHHCDNPRCVKPSHLFVGTQHDNVKDAMSKGRHKRPPGHGIKLTLGNARAVRRLHQKDGIGHREIAAMYGVHEATIRNILKGRTWKESLTNP